MSQNNDSLPEFGESEVNPYAPAITQSHVQQPANTVPVGGIWRDGDLLVVHKMATLPRRCIKSNEPIERTLKRNLTWHPPGYYVLIFVNLILYAIVAMIVRKTAVLHVGLADRFHWARKRNMLIAWSLVIVGLVSFVGGLIAMDGAGTNGDFLILIVLLGPISLIAGALLGIYGCRVVTPKKVDDHYVWLRGICPEYLAQFPDLPNA